MVLSLLCIVTTSILLYSLWRDGTVVAVQNFDGFVIQVREVPQVSGSILASPPGVADSAYVIEVGGNPPQATFRVYAGSEDFKPVAIVQSGQPGESTYKVQFSNKRQIGIRYANGQTSLIEWFRPVVVR